MKSSQIGIVIALILGIVIVFGIAAFLLSPQGAETALPTLVVINTASPSEEARNLPEVTLEPSLEPLPTETATIENTDVPTIEASITQIIAQVVNTETLAPSATLQVNLIQTQAPQATATSSGGIVVISTLSPSATLAPTNTQASGVGNPNIPPSATMDTTGLVVFNQPSNIGVGELRVLSMTVPADEVILSLGGNLPLIRPNEQWVLVELFLICPSTTNCAPSSNTFTLETNANSYSPTALNIESSFGSLILDNQVLGHIAYVIPRNENPAALELNLTGQTYRYALQ